MKKTAAAILFATAGLGFASTGDAVCNYYPSSTPTFVSGYGSVCGGSGYGCTECVDDAYNSCVTDGEVCTPIHRTKNQY